MAETKKNIKPTKETIVKGKIANAITSAAKNHIVATTDDVYDTNFLEYQDEINQRLRDGISTVTEQIEEIDNKIDGLSATTENIREGISNLSAATETVKSTVSAIENKIPNEASETNQLADKEYVNNLISKSSSYFRGSWANWTSVPTDSNEYPEDTNGNRAPKLGDYMVIEDASDYTIESGLTGTWRFTYTGDWDIDGKEAWVKEYQISKESQVTISFYWKYENDINENTNFITKKKISKTDTLISYPQLTADEFKDGGYWDVTITDLRCIYSDTNVTFVIPISYNNEIFDNIQLIELCYENGWCNSPEYITTYEMNNLTSDN